MSRKFLGNAVVVIFFSVYVLLLLTPVIGDPDLFWHLKTGEWIWQNKGLPDKDPFSFTIEPYQYETSARASFILKQYWLAQLMIYGFYSAGGLYGIILLRSLVYLCIGLLLYYWMKKEGINRLTALIFLMPAVYLSTYFIDEKPNSLSYIFAVILVYLLENLKNNSEGFFRQIRIPLVMLIWANMHGGFILGDAIIILYMAAEGIRLYGKKLFACNCEDKTFAGPRSSLHFFAVSIGSILISFANPNTYKVIPTLIELEGTQYSASIEDLLSPFKYVAIGDYKYLLIITAVVLLLIRKVKQLRFNSILMIAALVFLSLTRVRYIPFLLFISTPFIAFAWAGSFNKLSLKLEKFHLLFLTVFAFLSFLILGNRETVILKSPSISSFYPEASAGFIMKEKPEGELFNEYTFGGYLIWSLYPDYRVFIDGRGLAQPLFSTYNTVLSGSIEDTAGIPQWKAILQAYRVKSILVPGSNVVGVGFTRLVRRLVDDDEWSLVFVDKEALLFVKNTEQNRDIIRAYSMPKSLAYDKALEQADRYRNRYPGDWNAYATLGEIYLYMGKTGQALLNFEYAFKINPSLQSTSFGKLIEKLRAGRDYSGLLDEIFR